MSKDRTVNKKDNIIQKELELFKSQSIQLFINQHTKSFFQQNQINFDKYFEKNKNVQRTQLSNQSQFSNKTTTGSNDAQKSRQNNIQRFNPMQDYSQIINKYIEENDFVIQSESEVFELQFKIYYSQIDYVLIKIFTYIRPKFNNQFKGSPQINQNKSSQFSMDDLIMEQPVYIGDLKTQHLFQLVSKALEKSYKSNKYMQIYKLKPLSLQTFDCSAECIDYLLSKPDSRLVDFLYSPFNTSQDDHKHFGSGMVKEQLFDLDPRNDTLKLSAADLNLLSKMKQKKQETLKLKMCFVSTEYQKKVDPIIQQQNQKDPKNNKVSKRMSIKDFDLIRCLGQGAFAKVLLVRNKQNGKLFAMKVIHKKKIMMTAEDEDRGQDLSSEELAYRNMYRVKQIISERNIFSLLNKDPNPFIVQLHSAFTSKNYLYFVLDLCPGGDLFSLIQKHKKFTQQQAKLLFCEVLIAVEHLHKHNIFYRDLKPENILVDESGHLKLTDFGLSKQNFSQQDLCQTICGSPEYFCPEILQNKMYGRTLDFYSLGVLLYELITGLPPYYNSHQFQMQKDIIHKPLNISNIPNDCLDLIQGLLEKDPQIRLGSKSGIIDIKNHEFFKDVAWDYVQQQKYKYDKSFLKIDLLQSNFNYDDHIDVDCQKNIDINVDEEYSNSESQSTKENIDQDILNLELFDPRPFNEQVNSYIRKRSKSDVRYHQFESLVQDEDDVDEFKLNKNYQTQNQAVGNIQLLKKLEILDKKDQQAIEFQKKQELIKKEIIQLVGDKKITKQLNKWNDNQVLLTNNFKTGKHNQSTNEFQKGVNQQNKLLKRNTFTQSTKAKNQKSHVDHAYNIMLHNFKEEDKPDKHQDTQDINEKLQQKSKKKLSNWLRTISPDNCIQEEPDLQEVEEGSKYAIQQRLCSNDAVNLFDGFSYRKNTEAENSLGRPGSIIDNGRSVFPINNLGFNLFAHNQNSLTSIQKSNDRNSSKEIVINCLDQKPNFQIGAPKTPKENSAGSVIFLQDGINNLSRGRVDSVLRLKTFKLQEQEENKFEGDSLIKLNKIFDEKEKLRINTAFDERRSIEEDIKEELQSDQRNNNLTIKMPMGYMQNLKSNKTTPYNQQILKNVNKVTSMQKTTKKKISLEVKNKSQQKIKKKKESVNYLNQHIVNPNMQGILAPSNTIVKEQTQISKQKPIQKQINLNLASDLKIRDLNYSDQQNINVLPIKPTNNQQPTFKSNNKSQRKRRYSLCTFGNFEPNSNDNFELRKLQKQLTQQKNYPSDRKYQLVKSTTQAVLNKKAQENIIRKTGQMLVKNVVQMIQWERENENENKKSTTSEEIIDLNQSQNKLLKNKIDTAKQVDSQILQNSQLDTSQNRDKIDDFVDQMLNNSSISFLKDVNQDEACDNLSRHKRQKNSQKKEKKRDKIYIESDSLMNQIENFRESLYQSNIRQSLAFNLGKQVQLDKQKTQVSKPINELEEINLQQQYDEINLQIKLNSNLNDIVRRERRRETVTNNHNLSKHSEHSKQETKETNFSRRQQSGAHCNSQKVSDKNLLAVIQNSQSNNETAVKQFQISQTSKQNSLSKVKTKVTENKLYYSQVSQNNYKNRKSQQRHSSKNIEDDNINKNILSQKKLSGLQSNKKLNKIDKKIKSKKQKTPSNSNVIQKSKRDNQQTEQEQIANQQSTSQKQPDQAFNNSQSKVVNNKEQTFVPLPISKEDTNIILNLMTQDSQQISPQIGEEQFNNSSLTCFNQPTLKAQKPHLSQLSSQISKFQNQSILKSLPRYSRLTKPQENHKNLVSTTVALSQLTVKIPQLQKINMQQAQNQINKNQIQQKMMAFSNQNQSIQESSSLSISPSIKDQNSPKQIFLQNPFIKSLIGEKQVSMNAGRASQNQESIISSLIQSQNQIGKQKRLTFKISDCIKQMNNSSLQEQLLKSESNSINRNTQKSIQKINDQKSEVKMYQISQQKEPFQSLQNFPNQTVPSIPTETSLVSFNNHNNDIEFSSKFGFKDEDTLISLRKKQKNPHITYDYQQIDIKKSNNSSLLNENQKQGSCQQANLQSSLTIDNNYMKIENQNLNDFNQYGPAKSKLEQSSYISIAAIQKEIQNKAQYVKIDLQGGSMINNTVQQRTNSSEKKDLITQKLQNYQNSSRNDDQQLIQKPTNQYNKYKQKSQRQQFLNAGQRTLEHPSPSKAFQKKILNSQYGNHVNQMSCTQLFESKIKNNKSHNVSIILNERDINIDSSKYSEVNNPKQGGKNFQIYKQEKQQQLIVNFKSPRQNLLGNKSMKINFKKCGSNTTLDLQQSISLQNSSVEKIQKLNSQVSNNTKMNSSNNQNSEKSSNFKNNKNRNSSLNKKEVKNIYQQINPYKDKNTNNSQIKQMLSHKDVQNSSKKSISGQQKINNFTNESLDKVQDRNSQEPQLNLQNNQPYQYQSQKISIQKHSNSSLAIVNINQCQQNQDSNLEYQQKRKDQFSQFSKYNNQTIPQLNSQTIYQQQKIINQNLKNLYKYDNFESKKQQKPKVQRHKKNHSDMKSVDKNKISNINLNEDSNVIQNTSPKSCLKANVRKPSFESRQPEQHINVQSVQKGNLQNNQVESMNTYSIPGGFVSSSIFGAQSSFAGMKSQQSFEHTSASLVKFSNNNNQNLNSILPSGLRQKFDIKNVILQ